MLKEKKIGKVWVKSLKDHIFISCFNIDEKFQGKQYGSEMMQHIIEKHPGILELLVESKNEIAIKLYRKFNFKKVSKTLFNGKKVFRMVRLPS